MTDDELGMAWWNGLSEAERAKWAKAAGTGRTKDAWELFKGHGAIAAFLTHSVTEAYGEPLEAEPSRVDGRRLASCRDRSRPRR
jgi:hypothetical protein